MFENRSTGSVHKDAFVPSTNTPIAVQDPYALGLTTSGSNTAVASASAAPTYFGSGNDVIDLGNSNSFVHAGGGDNVVLGGLGNDEIYAGNGRDIIDAAVWTKDASGAFVLKDLGTFGAEQARLSDINEAGAIIGTTSGGSGATATSTPFLLRDGQFTALGSLGGKTGSAAALNEFGEVVGASQIASGANHAYV